MKLNLEMKIVGLVVITLFIGSLCIGFLGISFIQDDIRDIVDIYSNTTIDFIKNAIETTMITGNAEVTKDLLAKKRSEQSIESIIVFDTEGREAFSPLKTEGMAEDIKVIDRIKTTKNTFTQEGGDSIIYYVPLINTDRCIKCHEVQNKVIGVMKVSMSVKDAKSRVLYRTRVIITGLVFALFFFGASLWLIFKRTVINPIKELENFSETLSAGDFTFKTNIKARDEIGLLNEHLGESINNISTVIQRAAKVAERVGRVMNEVEGESKRVVEDTQVEAGVSHSIYASVEQLDRSIGEIAESIEGVSSSSEEVTVAVDEMVANIEQITQNSVDLSSAVDSTSSSIEQMSMSIQEIAERTNELTTASEETLSAVEEISAAVKEIDSNTKESARLSEKVTEEASGLGMDAINSTAEGIERIKTTVQRTSEFIKKLGGRSEEIGQILNVIDEITDQTTLLALNAAILAAQAGEHGKGFSVVADEIKGLAERTALSTQEIAALINSVQSEVKGAVDAMAEGLKTVEEGARLSDEAKEALKKIIESSKKSTEMALSIQIATSEQARGVTFVTDSMEKIKEMFRQIARATAEQAKGASLIISVSERMRDITAQVKNSNLEQTRGGKQIYQAQENVTMKIHNISNALKEQKSGSSNILDSLSKIADHPAKNRERAYLINMSLRNLQKDAELLITELCSFKVEEVKEKKDVIKFGVMPLESPSEMYRRFLPMADYLSRKLNKKIELHVAVDFFETVKNIGEGTIDFGYMTPSTYIEAKDKYNVEVLAKAVNKGKPYHHSIIIAKDGGKINRIEDLKGCSFAFGDRHSTSSYIMPRAMLQEAGISLKDLGFYAFLGHHDDVARAVLNGEFDAGGVMESTAEKFKNQGLKFVKSSSEIPEFNICVNKDLPKEEKALIKQSLLELNNNIAEHRKILQSINAYYTGFVESSDSDYEAIRDIMQNLNNNKTTS